MAKRTPLNFVGVSETLADIAIKNPGGDYLQPTTRAGFVVGAGLFAIAQAVREHTALQRRERDREHANREAFRKTHENAARAVARAAETPPPATPVAPEA